MTDSTDSTGTNAEQVPLAGIAVDIPGFGGETGADEDLDDGLPGGLDEDLGHFHKQFADTKNPEPAWKSVDLEDEDKVFREQVQNRIKKLTYQKHEAERKAEAEAQAAARDRAELVQYKAREAQHQQNGQVAALENERRDLAKQLSDLRKLDEFDDGYNPEALVDLELKLQDKTAELNWAKRSAQQSPRQEAPEPPPPQQDVPPEYALAFAWQDKNPRYAQDQAFKAQADKLYVDLVNDGYNPAHPRIFQEIDKLLSKNPDFRSPVETTRAGQEGGGQSGKSGGFSIADHRRAMLALGLNPDNPHDRAKYDRF